jgi:hypothetical protein
MFDRSHACNCTVLAACRFHQAMHAANTGHTPDGAHTALSARTINLNKENISTKDYCWFLEATASVLDPWQSQNVFSGKL